MGSAPLRLARTRFQVVRAALHVLAFAGLIVTMVVASWAQPYFTRGIETGDAARPIPYTDVNPMGINTFLNEEPDPQVVTRSLDMIRDGGYGYIRQIFGWYEIEPEPGVFVDANGNSTWEKYDRIVNLASERGIQIIARLEKPPPWAKAHQPHPEIDGPPDDLSDYGNFVRQVVSRYRGRVQFVQIWNEPNLEGEWGNQPIDPQAYVDLLKVGYSAAKHANPDVVVLLAGLAPTDQLGPANLSDLIFLQKVYDAGGAAWFDIATVMDYGYGYSPNDRRVSFARNNFSRPIQTREIMVRNGDASTPIWAVEYGWVSLPKDWQGDPSPWGKPVSAQTQAEYLVGGYLRAQREWPWMGMMAVWTFRFPHPPDAPDQAGNPTRGFALVNYDFSPTPAYTALQRAAPTIQARSTGSYLLHADEQKRLASGGTVSLPILGEQIDLIVDGKATVTAQVDDHASKTFTVSGQGRQRVTIASDLPSRRHDITISIADDGAEVIGYVVENHPTSTWIYPWIYGALAVTLLLNLASLGWMVWDYRWKWQRR
jgi:hypothetical protein